MSSVRPSVGVVLVAVGGACGALARWGVGEFAAGPSGTLAVNVVGSFLLAGLTVRGPSERTRLAAGTGFCSSFTTYSAFAVEAV
ncbi:MAG: CrcB family protein, partial [Halobaculum sp.]